MAGAIERMYATLMDRGYVKTLFGYLQDFQERAGGYIARCPFHEDEHPTLIIYRDRPGYFCFVCGARGDWLRFLQLAKHGFLNRRSTCWAASRPMTPGPGQGGLEGS